MGKRAGETSNNARDCETAGGAHQGRAKAASPSSHDGDGAKGGATADLAACLPYIWPFLSNSLDLLHLALVNKSTHAIIKCDADMSLRVYECMRMYAIRKVRLLQRGYGPSLKLDPPSFVQLVSYLLPPDAAIQREAVWMLQECIEHQIIQSFEGALHVCIAVRRPHYFEDYGPHSERITAQDWDVARKLQRWGLTDVLHPMKPASGHDTARLSAMQASFTKGIRHLARVGGALGFEPAVFAAAWESVVGMVVRVVAGERASGSTPAQPHTRKDGGAPRDGCSSEGHAGVNGGSDDWSAKTFCDLLQDHWRESGFLAPLDKRVKPRDLSLMKSLAASHALQEVLRFVIRTTQAPAAHQALERIFERLDMLELLQGLIEAELHALCGAVALLQTHIRHTNPTGPHDTHTDETHDGSASEVMEVVTTVSKAPRCVSSVPAATVLEPWRAGVEEVTVKHGADLQLEDVREYLLSFIWHAASAMCAVGRYLVEAEAVCKGDESDDDDGVSEVIVISEDEGEEGSVVVVEADDHVDDAHDMMDDDATKALEVLQEVREGMRLITQSDVRATLARMVGRDSQLPVLGDLSSCEPLTNVYNTLVPPVILPSSVPM